MQSAQPLDAIPDPRLRELIGQILARAESLGAPLFIALGYAVGRVDCFDVALPAPLPEFLRGCAHFCFPRSPMLPKPVTSAGAPRNYSEISDGPLKALLENMVARVLELRFSCCASVRLGAEDCTSVGCLPAGIATHLDLCFRIAAGAAPARQERPRPELSRLLVN
jgi:hypothetical protein